ncbi:MAG: hypothetical protein NTV76_00040 [Pseudomonas sp.]|nr:hypothetical protein [Pseudomonas sp.]
MSDPDTPGRFLSPRCHTRYTLVSSRACNSIQAFKQCSVPPMADGGVEIVEIRPNWLHQSLPADARIRLRIRRSRLQQRLTT